MGWERTPEGDAGGLSVLPFSPGSPGSRRRATPVLTLLMYSDSPNDQCYSDELLGRRELPEHDDPDAQRRSHAAATSIDSPRASILAATPILTIQ